jgi:hypothetical protein
MTTKELTNWLQNNQHKFIFCSKDECNKDDTLLHDLLVIGADKKFQFKTFKDVAGFILTKARYAETYTSVKYDVLQEFEEDSIQHTFCVNDVYPFELLFNKSQFLH